MKKLVIKKISREGACRFFAVFSALTIAVALLWSVLPVHGEGEVYDKTLRLHVLANSDSREDQALKLKVRDALLGVITDLVKDCLSKEQAAAIIEANIEALTTCAEDCVRMHGYDYPVTVLTGTEKYPTRVYEGVSLPAGSYWSLRVLIGEGEGQNWWCVLYPPLCIDSAKAEEELVEAGFSPDQVRLLTEQEDTKYVLRFRILEVLRAWWEEMTR